MKELKLEVGKTYRNRAGQEVKIVAIDTGDTWPYRGSNGELYTENGRWSTYYQHPNDLIAEIPEPRYTFITPDDWKEVTATRYTFNIPDGVKELTLDYFGNRIVVEMVPEKNPKPGDVMKNEHGSVYIFKEAHCNGWHNHFAWLGESGRLYVESQCISGRPATPEEAQPLWAALKKAGKRWNAETMQVEEIAEIDRILEWVETNIKDGYYNQEDVAEAIEGYLKHKEDKK